MDTNNYFLRSRSLSLSHSSPRRTMRFSSVFKIYLNLLRTEENVIIIIGRRSSVSPAQEKEGRRRIPCTSTTILFHCAHGSVSITTSMPTASLCRLAPSSPERESWTRRSISCLFLITSITKSSRDRGLAFLVRGNEKKGRTRTE